MIVNRVFCYSKEVAKKNGIRLPILELVLLTVIFIAWIIVSVMMFESMKVSHIMTLYHILVVLKER